MNTPTVERLGRDVAIAFALGMADRAPSEPADAGVAAFCSELERRGFMVVARDFGKEGLKPDYFFRPESSSEVHAIDELSTVLEDDFDLQLGDVAEVGRLMKLPSVFCVRIPIGGPDDTIEGYELEEYATRQEADAMAKYIVSPEGEDA